jgi:hypothetical protein
MTDEREVRLMGNEGVASAAQETKARAGMYLRLEVLARMPLASLLYLVLTGGAGAVTA